MQSSSSENCICHNNIEILNTFGPELQYINTKLIIKNTLKNCQVIWESLKFSQYCSHSIRDKIIKTKFPSIVKLVAIGSNIY